MQFWHYSELAQTPWVRAQSHKTAPVSDTSHKWGSPDYPRFCPADCRCGCFHDLSSPSLIIHENESQKSWKPLYLWLQLYYKEYSLGTAKWKRCTGQDIGVGCCTEPPYPIWVGHPLSTLRCSPILSPYWRIFILAQLHSPIFILAQLNHSPLSSSLN